MPATSAWLASAEAMFNRSIFSSSEAAQLARRLNDTSLQIEVEGVTRVRVAMQGGRLALLTGADSRSAGVAAGAPAPGDAMLGDATPGNATKGDATRSNNALDGQPPADAVISGSPSALFALLRGARPAAGAERKGVTIRGDAEVANLYRQFFLAARPDLEEELSRWIGDAPARGVSRLAGGILSWANRARRVAGENVAEYLTEESRDLVARTEVEEFLQGVDELREAADRVEARLKEMGRRLQGSV
jgi:ubiquinone biosynthesis protein UbiJ